MTPHITTKDPEKYIKDRLKDLSVRLIDAAAEVFGEKATAEHRDFDNYIDRRLRNGAKFVPRKRQPR